MLPYLMAGASLAQGIMGNRAANKQAKRARQIGEYNAKVAEIQAEAEQASIDFQSRQLVKQQREVKAQQRMSIAGRGGLEAGTDLLSLIESAKNMQLDLLEMQRQQDISRIAGETQAQQIRMGSQAQSRALKAQGQQALLSGVLDAAGELAPTFGQTTKPTGSFLESIKKAPSRPTLRSFKYTDVYNPLQKYGF